MIRIGSKEVTAIYLGTRVLSAVYKGSALVWQAVRSCFGSGWWLNGKQFINNETWKNK